MWCRWLCERDAAMFGICVFVVAVSMAGIVAATDPNTTQSSNLCVDDGASLHCGEGFGVHVQEMQCGHDADKRKCSPTYLEAVRRLCQGQRWCGGLGLRDIFTAHCHSPLVGARRVVVTFRCQQAPEPAPACRTNLCSNVTQGLSCPANSVLHVHNLTCQVGLSACSAPTFVTLFTLCEGRRECDASGLRMLPSLASYCAQATPPELRNVFVDYVCVPDKLVWNHCKGHEYHSLTEPFGVLMNPGFTEQALDTWEQCNWFLTPENETRQVHVLVHMAYSKWGAGSCTSSFLQIRFKDCETSESRTRLFCNLHQVNSRVTSCGPVYVYNWMPSASDQADRFLLSYQMVQKGSDVGIPEGLPVCSTRLLTPTPTPLITTRPTMDRRNYGPGGTMFDYSDTIRHTGEDAETEEKPTEGTLQLKLIILYVFFGVVIIALVIALVYVLVSYRGISRRGQHQGDSSEKAALWRHDDTPLDTFNTNSHASLSDAATSNPHTSPTTPDTIHTPLTPDSQVVACTVHAESMPDDNHRHSSGSRFSSFLPGKETEQQHNGLATITPFAGEAAGRGGGSLPRSWSSGSGRGMSRSSTKSSSFKMNGELSNIYESINAPQEDHHPHPLLDLHPHHHHHDPNHDEDGGEETPLVQAPPSPPLPPPPPPLAMGYDPSYVDHYVVNNDEYALVRKPKSPKGRGKGSHNSSPASPSSHYANSALPVTRGDSLEGPDPAYNDGVNIFRDKTGPVVGFRPTSGPYDRDRSSRSEPVSPSSGGTSRHRWDEL